MNVQNDNNFSNQTSDERKIKVALYIRAKAEQPHSLERKIEDFKYKISHNPNWELICVYSDKIITGKKAYRPELKRLLKDIDDNKYDLVIFESISAYSRYYQDVINLYKLFNEKHIDVIFEKEKINTINNTKVEVF